MTKKEQIAKIKAAISYCRESISQLEGSDNPQIIESLIVCRAKIDAYEAVLAMMMGNSVYINIEGKQEALK